MNNGFSGMPLTGPDAEFLPDGRPRPLGGSGLPLMERREANWHAHVSGMTEREQAEAAGDPAALGALVSGAAGVTVIGGSPLRPFNLGTSIVLEMMGSAYAATNAPGMPIALRALDVARAVLAFSDPEWVYQALHAQKHGMIDQRATELAFRLDGATMGEINDWMNREMAEFNTPSNAGKKPLSPVAPAGGSSPVPPGPLPPSPSGEAGMFPGGGPR
jgi:hypothetical protein